MLKTIFDCSDTYSFQRHRIFCRVEKSMMLFPILQFATLEQRGTAQETADSAKPVSIKLLPETTLVPLVIVILGSSRSRMMWEQTTPTSVVSSSNFNTCSQSMYKRIINIFI